MNYGIQYTPCPAGAHYQHGKVERKIREVKKSVKINVQNARLLYSGKLLCNKLLIRFTI